MDLKKITRHIALIRNYHQFEPIQEVQGREVRLHYISLLSQGYNMLPWAGLTNPACNSLFIHNGCCDIFGKSVLSRLFLSSFLLYYYITVTGTPNFFFMMQRWLNLSSNSINSKLIRDPYFKVLTLICKGHLFNQDQYFTSKHLYSLIPWSQQQRHMGSDSWRQKEGEEGGVSVSCFVLFYLLKKSPQGWNVISP